MYARLIPPGAADVAHYLVQVPPHITGRVHFTAKLNYRKFSWYYTNFSYAGQPKPNQPPQLLSTNFNSLEYDFNPRNVPSNVSGQMKGVIPDLPIETLAKAELSLPVSENAPVWNTATGSHNARERWNDWGIGLLLQGDLKGAEFAFRKAAAAEPGYADAWLNTARSLILEGETDAAKPFIAQALKLDPSLGRIYYFRALIEKTEGRYDDALASLPSAPIARKNGSSGQMKRRRRRTNKKNSSFRLQFEATARRSVLLSGAARLFFGRRCPPTFSARRCRV